jgi:hypothetical protein
MDWGFAFWRFVHWFALHAKGHDLLKQLPDFIPCEQCKLEWEDPKEGQDLVVWSLNIHNKVNAKLGRYDKWDLTDFHIAQKTTCDRCAHADYTPFPWGFIHVIASDNSVKALQFLKRFDEIYPCPSCNSTFFIDDPALDESIAEWSIRHHKRIDPSFQTTSTAFDTKCNGCETSTAYISHENLSK